MTASEWVLGLWAVGSLAWVLALIVRGAWWKAETARLLRAVLRLIETDVRELSDAVVEIDEREAAHYVNVIGRIDTLAAYVERTANLNLSR